NSNPVHTGPSTTQNPRTPGSSMASSSKTILMNFLFLHLKIIFFRNQGFARVNDQGIQEWIVTTHGAHIPSDLKRLVGGLGQINFTFVQQRFFEREPVFLRHIRSTEQAGHFRDLCRTAEHYDRFFVAAPINPVEALRSW